MLTFDIIKVQVNPILLKVKLLNEKYIVVFFGETFINLYMVI